VRKTNLARSALAHRRRIFIAEYERGEIGADLFRVACNTGFERLSRSAMIMPTTISEAGNDARPLLIWATRSCSRMTLIVSDDARQTNSMLAVGALCSFRNIACKMTPHDCAKGVLVLPERRLTVA